jgi:tetraacyldisaccharide 4'-kinase
VIDLRTALPKAWAQQSSWLLWLLPFSALYAVVTAFRRTLFRFNVIKVYQSPVPVMIIGNITVGGSGKTPLLIELVRYLTVEQKLNVGVISRGYGGDETIFPHIVQPNDLATSVGDEPLLIVQQTGVALSVGSNRKASIECLIAHAESKQKPLDIILSDDGLQHLALARQLEWIVVDTDRGFGNGFLLPTGFLRENPERLELATVIEHGTVAKEIHASPYQMHLVAGELEPLLPLSFHHQIRAPQPPQRVHAVAGIGSPIRFFNSLRDLGYEVIEHPFADHHPYQANDVKFDDDLPIITTAKDAPRLQGLISFNVWVLPVKASLTPECYALLFKQLSEIGVLQERRQINR